VRSGECFAARHQRVSVKQAAYQFGFASLLCTYIGRPCESRIAPGNPHRWGDHRFNRGQPSDKAFAESRSFRSDGQPGPVDGAVTPPPPNKRQVGGLTRASNILGVRSPTMTRTRPFERFAVRFSSCHRLMLRRSLSASQEVVMVDHRGSLRLGFRRPQEVCSSGPSRAGDCNGKLLNWGVAPDVEVPDNGWATIPAKEHQQRQHDLHVLIERLVLKNRKVEPPSKPKSQTW